MQVVECVGSRLFVEVSVCGLNLLVRVGTIEVLVFPVDVASDNHPTACLVGGIDGFEDESLVLLSGLKGQGFTVSGDEEAWVSAREGVSTRFNVFEELFVFVSGHKVIGHLRESHQSRIAKMRMKEVKRSWKC
jgi:hypothetical protein